VRTLTSQYSLGTSSPTVRAALRAGGLNSKLCAIIGHTAGEGGM
jgi:hypothetical protein